MAKYNVVTKAKRAGNQERKRALRGDSAGKLRHKQDNSIPVSGKRKRKLFKKWRREQKEALQKGLVTMEDVEMAVAEERVRPRRRRNAALAPEPRRSPAANRRCSPRSPPLLPAIAAAATSRRYRCSEPRLTPRLAAAPAAAARRSSPCLAVPLPSQPPPRPATAETRRRGFPRASLLRRDPLCHRRCITAVAEPPQPAAAPPEHRTTAAPRTPLPWDPPHLATVDAALTAAASRTPVLPHTAAARSCLPLPLPPLPFAAHHRQGNLSSAPSCSTVDRSTAAATSTRLRTRHRRGNQHHAGFLDHCRSCCCVAGLLRVKYSQAPTNSHDSTLPGTSKGTTITSQMKFPLKRAKKTQNKEVKGQR